MNPNQLRVATFDCYGTLVDWEGGAATFLYDLVLRQGEPISGVAFACGFADQSHLTRVFKRHFGLTPGAYQKA